jgi:hypothetical protein
MFRTVNQKFDSVQVDGSVSNDTADADRYATVRVGEFNIDPISYSQICKNKQADPTLADLGTASSYSSRARQIAGNDTDWYVNQTPLPSALTRC